MATKDTTCRKKIPREYQTLSFQEAKHQNTIINLDTGLGKTLIACLLIQNELKQSQNKHKIIIFLAPQVFTYSFSIEHTTTHINSKLNQYKNKKVPLVEQQARFIAHEVPEAIVRKLHGQMHLSHNEWTHNEWKLYLEKGGNVFIMTPSIFNNMLIHSHIKMNDICLIIFDECHHISGRDDYRIIMQYHYKRYPIYQRPKIFGMSAPLIKGTSNINKIERKINELSFILNSSIFHPKTKDIHLFKVKPNIEYITYNSYNINPSQFEYIWPSDPGLNEEKWEREQDHFYRVLDELGERAAVLALDLFIKTDEKNVFLHKFPMEKIVHDQLLRKEFQIDFDYQTKKKILKKNWYHFKKKSIQQFNDKNNKENIDVNIKNDKQREFEIYDDDLKLNKPLLLHSLFDDETKMNGPINDEQKKMDLKSSEKPKYSLKSSKIKEKLRPKSMFKSRSYTIF